MNRRQDVSLCKEKEVLGWIAFIWVNNHTNVTFSIPVVEKGEIHWEDDQWEVEQIQGHCVEDVCTMFYLLLSQGLINCIHL
jgi:hypothetical protein